MEPTKNKPTCLTDPHKELPIVWEKGELVDEDEEFGTEGWIMYGIDANLNTYSGVADFKFGELVDDIYDIELRTNK